MQRAAVGRHLDPTGYNIWNRVANEVDNQFRVRTLIDALQRGEPEDVATQLARDAVLDYGRLTGFERATINRVIWFWTFQSRFLASTVRALLDHPGRLYTASRFGGRDLSGVLTGLGVPDVKYEDDEYSADYMRGRAYKVLIEDPDLRERYALYGPDLPLSSGLTMLLDAMSGFVLVASLASPPADKDRIDVAGDITSGAVETVVGNAAPGVQALAIAMQYSPDTWDNEPSTYLDPRLVASIQQVGLWDVFTSIVEVEPYDDPGKVGTSYEGSVWKVRDSSRARWQAMQLAMLSAGIQRTLRTYGPLLDEATMERVQRDPRMRTLPAMGALLGVATPANALSRIERANLNEKAVVNELRDRSRR